MKETVLNAYQKIHMKARELHFQPAEANIHITLPKSSILFGVFTPEVNYLCSSLSLT